MTRIAILRRNADTAQAIEKILGLPNGRWDNLKVRVDLDSLPTATVTLFIDANQLAGLAELAVAGAIDDGHGDTP